MKTTRHGLYINEETDRELVQFIMPPQPNRNGKEEGS